MSQLTLHRGCPLCLTTTAGFSLSTSVTSPVRLRKIHVRDDSVFLLHENRIEQVQPDFMVCIDFQSLRQAGEWINTRIAEPV